MCSIDLETWTELGFDPALYISITGYTPQPFPFFLFVKENRRWMRSSRWQIVRKNGVEQFIFKRETHFYRNNTHDETVLREYSTEEEAKKILAMLMMYGAQMVEWTAYKDAGFNPATRTK